jgi:DNA polymerase
MNPHALENTMRDMTSPTASPDDPRDELAELALGVARHARRRAALGERRAARAQARPRADEPGESADTRPPEGAEPARSAEGGEPARSAADVARQARAARDLAELERGVAQCQACTLCRTRQNTVFMDGHGARRVLFVGEAPGAEEDRRGLPFVGRAGELLTDIITKGMGLARDEVYIANVLKCRPPDNRDPTTEEKATCTPWLDRQIELTDPAVIIPLGRHAAMHVLGVTASMGAMRGRVHERGGRKIVATFHPAYLLRNPADKKECWKDIQVAMGLIGIAPPAKPAGAGGGA